MQLYAILIKSYSHKTISPRFFSSPFFASHPFDEASGTWACQTAPSVRTPTCERHMRKFGRIDDY